MKQFLCFMLIVIINSGGSNELQAQNTSRSPTSEAAARQSPLYGSVPFGKAAGEVIPISLSEALKRGLKYNLGLLLAEQSVRTAQGVRRRVLSDLLPNITVNASESGEQVNLAALGFTGFANSAGFPGIPTVIGPFNVFDSRVFLSQSILDFNARYKVRTEGQNLKAAESSYKNTREQVVLVCSDLYLQLIAGKSQIDSQRAQLETAQALYNLAADRKKAGVTSGIDVLRAQVQLRAQQQRLIVAENNFAKQKLALARAIGLPLGQDFSPSDQVQYVRWSGPALGEAVERAYENRGDYQSALSSVRAAEFSKKAAAAESLPTMNFSGNYGLIGPRIASTHGAFSVAANLRIPIFQGGRVRAKVLEADAFLHQQQDQLEELRARVYYEIQTAFLDMSAAEARVEVAGSARDLAEQQVREVKDRFAAGVANTVEVVQAQEALATASDNYISSLYADNIAKATVAAAMGEAEDTLERILRGK